MNETIRQDERYPEWMKAWNARAAEIDKHIIEYFQKNAQQTGEALDEIVHQVEHWFEQQELNAEAREQHHLAKQEDELHFRDRLEARIAQLREEGMLADATAEDIARAGQSGK